MIQVNPLWAMLLWMLATLFALLALYFKLRQKIIKHISEKYTEYRKIHKKINIKLFPKDKYLKNKYNGCKMVYMILVCWIILIIMTIFVWNMNLFSIY